jgi:hypothetical protein
MLISGTGHESGDLEFIFAELGTLCWNLLYAFVRYLGAFERELGP